ncbi:hypothetical protein CYLTODRAFT_442756 [Cylindrobasidium torrendii FP15055 ss-10]|uniref:C2H2-type domain-containing protein n=1 Tax=Cylindrobasidium torrendii FP15055 ss-10 TaxID=1314674 RepID=A0A0D7BFM2_9AGAR|nr:hypothetical protein CYLTODRAFT_442756 [Cylindrobasidium torrendii FP15055 ss-10]
MGLMDMHVSLANDSTSGLDPILPHLHLEHCVPSYGFPCDEDYEDPYICHNHLWRSDDNTTPSLLSAAACPSPCMQAYTPPLTDSSSSPASSDECLSPLSSGSPLLLDGFQLPDNLKPGDSPFATVERDPQSPLPTDFPSPCLSTSSPHCPGNLLPWHGTKTAALADIHPPTPGSQECKCRGVKEEDEEDGDDSVSQHPMDLDLGTPSYATTSPPLSPAASSPCSSDVSAGATYVPASPIRSKKTSSKRQAAASPYRVTSSPRRSSDNDDDDDDAPFEPPSKRPSTRRAGKRYVCKICGETFVRKHDLEVRHMRTKHNDGASPPCLFCGKSLSRKDGRNRHMYTSAGCPFVLVRMRKAGVIRKGEIPMSLEKDVAEEWIDRDLLESLWIETDTEWIVKPAGTAATATNET